MYLVAADVPPVMTAIQEQLGRKLRYQKLIPRNSFSGSHRFGGQGSALT